MTALMLAIKLGHNAIAKALLKRGANAHAKRPDGADEGATVVYVAARVGNEEMVGVLAEAGANVKTPDNVGCTPLYASAWNGHAGTIRLLASLGADPIAPNRHGHTPLHIAVYCGHLAAAQALILLGAPVTAQDLKQYRYSRGDTAQLRAQLTAWATTEIERTHRFRATVLFGCSRHSSAGGTNPHLSMLAGGGTVVRVRELIGQFCGIVVGTELRLRREAKEAIAAINLHDEDED